MKLLYVNPTDFDYFDKSMIATKLVSKGQFYLFDEAKKLIYWGTVANEQLNIVYSKPSLWARFKLLFRKRKKKWINL
jgi:hypothetical protein